MPQDRGFALRRIAVINQKGGVGKTTTAVNLGAALAARGKRVLLIDMDPQAHLTLHLSLDSAPEAPCIYDCLTRGTSLGDVLHPVTDNLWAVGSCIDMAGLEIELAETVGRERLLCDAIQNHPINHDFILIDCPPSLGTLTVNSLVASDEVFIPLQPHFLALQGVGRLLETISLVRQRINPRLQVTGMVLCLYETGTRLASEVAADLASFLERGHRTSTPWAKARLFETIIRRNIRLAECPSYGQSIFQYAPHSRGAQDYAALAEEVLAMDTAGPEEGLVR